MRGVDDKGVVEIAWTKEVVTLATRMGRNTRQANETKLTIEERAGKYD